MHQYVDALLSEISHLPLRLTNFIRSCSLHVWRPPPNTAASTLLLPVSNALSPSILMSIC